MGASATAAKARQGSLPPAPAACDGDSAYVVFRRPWRPTAGEAQRYEQRRWGGRCVPALPQAFTDTLSASASAPQRGRQGRYYRRSLAQSGAPRPMFMGAAGEALDAKSLLAMEKSRRKKKDLAHTVLSIFGARAWLRPRRAGGRPPTQALLPTVVMRNAAAVWS
eukprot:TRINITY_DN65056_c0_g1_i1.p1 TRINITY_DN65056_c0_g1~~TRINITY_DN65056_c0_g1_i1.p1  ORF type:complete len:190 (+),score=39.51 TRINITY_DN65056_c0_g1_i1:78-572(+)